MRRSASAIGVRTISGGNSGSLTLRQRPAQSITVVPVRLSIIVGDGNPRVGRDRIVRTSRKMGITLASSRHGVAADRRR